MLGVFELANRTLESDFPNVVLIALPAGSKLVYSLIK
jgi:hypothetical protein